ncbi:MAG TPA: ABC transporter ATP-binding protein [bacterium]|nr:ABC transporter ATP-binding protein [bacterium]
MLTVAAACRLGAFTLDVAFRSASRRTVLFGPSGAGKTMTLQCMAGFLVPPRGSVAIRDTVLLDTGRGINVPPWRRRVGVVLQGDALFPHLDAAANVAYGMRRVWRGREPTRALALLAAVGLPGYGDRRPANLSAGERQRVALARALASDPRALLLDEPFSAVDAPVREQLRRDLLALVDARDLPTVVVTHDFDEAHVLGETIVVLVAGRVVQTGVPADVAARPRTATVARLVGAANVLRGRVVGRDKAGAVVRADPFLLRVANPGPDEHQQISVRPEHLRIGPAGSGGMEARVERVLARRAGATVLLAAGGLHLEVWVSGAPPAPGTTVDVSIPDGAAHALEPEDEPRAAERGPAVPVPAAR